MIDVDEDSTFDGALHFAASRGNIARVERLIGEGADIDEFDELAWTPLHHAVKEEQVEMVIWLLDQGADVNAHLESKIGETPLGKVAQTCSLRMAEVLVRAGANPTIPGWMGITALDRAKERKRGDGPRVFALLSRAARRLWS